MIKLLKLSFISLQFITIVAIASVIYGLIELRTVTLSYVFIANFITAAIVISVSIIIMITPVILKKDKLLDHSTYAERYYDVREKKQHNAFKILYLGLLNVVFTVIIEIIIIFFTQ